MESELRMTGGAAIGIICKAPRVGKSKTRLIPTLGPDLAARLSGCFLRDIGATIAALPASVGARGYAIYAPADAEPELRALMPPDFGYLFHGDGNLGNVLDGATRNLLALGHDCVLLVNSDSPTLPPALLEQAEAALREGGDRVVFGPATDGGYYLVGLKAAHPHIFADIAWSTGDVLAQSLARAAEIGLSVRLLDPWYDVDDFDSLAILRAELAGLAPACSRGLRGGPATATRALLASPEARLHAPK